jgi:hypothetical protein
MSSLYQPVMLILILHTAWPLSSSPNCLVFSFTLPNRHSIIAALTKIITRSCHPSSIQ